MSTHFTVVCDTDEVDGPTIRNNAHKGAVLMCDDPMGEAPVWWRDFLHEHEFCSLRLVREGSPTYKDRP